MVRDNFAIFILSHGRPDEVFTVKTLQKVGYTGKYYFIIDNIIILYLIKIKELLFIYIDFTNYMFM